MLYGMVVTLFIDYAALGKAREGRRGENKMKITSQSIARYIQRLCLWHFVARQEDGINFRG
jgi:hypothetical protein